MIVQFFGKQVVIPHGYKMIGDNRFISGGGTEYRLVSISDDIIKLESIYSGRRRTTALEIIGSDESISTLQFINSYLKGKAKISIFDNNGIKLYGGTVADLPRSIVDNSVVSGINGLGSINDIIIRIDHLLYVK